MELASLLGCKVASFPSKYLGIPLCKGKPRKSCWDMIIDKMERRLSTWKGRYLSLGGRVVLIKAILSNLLVYCLSAFKCPVAVIENLEKIQRNFLWYDDSKRRKLYLVSWSQVCKAKEEGGLGIRPLWQVNDALLGKWLGDSSDGLWKDIL